MKTQKNWIDEIAMILLRGEMENNKNKAADETIQRLDDSKDINQPGESDRTFLHHCCAYGYDDLARIAIEKGADVNAQEQNGFSPLHVAVKMDNFALADYLLRNGALPELKDKYGNTAVFYASGNWEIMKLLLDWGCDIHSRNFYNVSAYDMALLRPDIAEQLQEYLKQTCYP